MKLPSINKPTSASINKPSSAQLANRQLPPRQSNNAISNLEKNLFNKLNEYDDLNKIDTKKVQVSEVKLKKKIENQNDEMELFEKRTNTFKNYSQTEKIKDQKQTQQKQQQQQDTVFLTHNQQVKSEESNNEQNDSNSDSSIEDLLQRGRTLDKQKKVMLNFEDDSEVGQLNKMLFQTDIDLDEQFQSMCILKRTISQMQESMKSLGYGINEQLMNDLNQKYEEMIKLQRESQAIEEYQMKEGNQKNKMPALRSNSVNQQKKSKK